MLPREGGRTTGEVSHLQPEQRPFELFINEASV